jgi:AraC-like DNA-binding protein
VHGTAAAGAARTTLATVGQIIARLLEMHGLDAATLLREQGIDPRAITDAGLRIPTAQWDAVVRRAAPQIDDPAFGLRAARCWHPSNLGALGHAWLAAPTLRAGLELLVRYWKIIGGRWVPALAETRDELSFVLHDPYSDGLVAPIATDITFAVVLDMCRMNFGAALRPLRVELMRARPPHHGEYPAFYGCPVRFAAARRALVLRRGDAERALPSSNRRIALALDRVITEELARLDRNDLLARCKAVLLETLPAGPLGEVGMAKRLHLSRRTLQRKLAARATSYKKLLDGTRRELALRFVEDPQRSLADVTFELGFSQQSALTRAFRRWTGSAPSQWRERRAAGAPQPAAQAPVS